MGILKQPWEEAHVAGDRGVLQTASKKLRAAVRAMGESCLADPQGLAKASDDRTLPET